MTPANLAVLAALGLALAGCSAETTSPTSPDPAAAAVDPWASCTVLAVGEGYRVALEWSRLPVKEIVIVREILPSQSHSEVLRTPKRKGSLTVLLGFRPTAALFVDQHRTTSEKATCALSSG